MINLHDVLKNFPALSRQLTCKGMLFTQYDCPQIEKAERFLVDCSFILYVISGRRIFHKNDQSWELKEGVCAFIKKGTHISEKPPGEGWCVMIFFMPDNFLKQLINENRNSLPLHHLPPSTIDHVLPLVVNELSQSFFTSMLPYFSQSLPPPEHLLELKFKELVLSLLSNKQNNHFLSYLHSLSNDQLPSIEEVMHNNYTFNLSLEEYAKLAYKSLPTFKREFKKLFNDSPARWVLNKRLTLASELLQNSPKSIGEICFQCGFENQAHFSRVFKEKTGLSPLQFRSNQQTTSTTGSE